MADRIELNDNEMEDVVGGVLRWKNGEVWVKTNPDCKYRYADYNACKAWLVTHWNGTQDESCLAAMAAEGLVFPM